MKLLINWYSKTLAVLIRQSIVVCLTLTIGLPYFSLSATAPLVQGLLGRAQRDTSVYRLYAVSNFAFYFRPRCACSRSIICCGPVSNNDRVSPQLLRCPKNPAEERSPPQLPLFENASIKDSPANTDIVLGDARLSLQKEAPQTFDIILIDAFNGDSIPIHLITYEAFALYRALLKPDGILVVHISNFYLDLTPVVAKLTAAVGLNAVRVTDKGLKTHAQTLSKYVVAGADVGFLSTGEGTSLDLLGHAPNFPLWTDNYNNLTRVMYLHW